MPFVIGDYVSRTKAIMDECGWVAAHFLVHVHCGYGLAEAMVLESLFNGCDGIWCALSRQGAATGHANSLTTVTNLHRHGNSAVQKKYNLMAMRKAAIAIERIVTGEDPHPMTELYGSRSMDLCFDEEGGMMGHTDFELNVENEFKITQQIRVSSMTSPHLFSQALSFYLGERQWDMAVCEAMQRILLDDLVHERKEEYNSLTGLLSLYERGGGRIDHAMEEVLLHDEQMNDHPVLQKVQEYCLSLSHGGGSDVSSLSLSYRHFYDGFLARYVKDPESSLGRQVFSMLDLDGDGVISWAEIEFRVKWVIKEHPEQCSDVSGVIDSLLTNYIFPEVSLHRTASRRRVSVTNKQKMALPGSSDNNPYGGVDTGSTMTVTSRDRSPGPCTHVEEGTYGGGEHFIDP